MRQAPVFAFAAVLTALAPGLAAQTVPTGFIVETLVSTGLTAPNDFCFLPDGRILIANRPGDVTVYAGGSTANTGMVPNVQVGSEFGLLSIAPDPLFPQNGYIYVWYSSNDVFMHLDRFTMTGDLANAASTNLTLDTTSRRVVLNAVPNNAFNHNGGSTRFGPDGRLYQSIGDDAGTCAAQLLTNQQGVILRMDVSSLPAGGSTTAPTYASLNPLDNPQSNTTDIRQLLLAYGLRNPVRMTIDPLTNNLYIGDVGQSTREEYDEYTYVSGALQLINFGWPWREGLVAYTTCAGSQPVVVNPIADADSPTQGWHSVMGGPRYRNRGGQYDFGAGYEGNAFFSDYFAGQVRMLSYNGTAWAPAAAVPGQPSTTNWATNCVGLVSYDVGADGAIYLVQHPQTYATAGGFLKRIRPVGPTNSVVAVSGSNQIGPATEAFAQPLVARVLDSNGQPIAGGQVNFSVVGSATLSTTNPVLADSNGEAQTSVTAGNGGGQITISANTPNGSQTPATFSLFSRRLSVISTPTLIVLQITNTSPAPQVPFLVLCSVPGIQPLPTFFGPVCTDPYNPLTFVVEDSLGFYGFASLSGSGAIGTPGLTKIYYMSTTAFSGITMNFQAIGLDPIGGLFRSNCEVKTF
jgi:glucose/arabinose dehydrogenase